MPSPSLVTAFSSRTLRYNQNGVYNKNDRKSHKQTLPAGEPRPSQHPTPLSYWSVHPHVTPDSPKKARGKFSWGDMRDLIACAVEDYSYDDSQYDSDDELEHFDILSGDTPPRFFGGTWAVVN